MAQMLGTVAPEPRAPLLARLVEHPLAPPVAALTTGLYLGRLGCERLPQFASDLARIGIVLAGLVLATLLPGLLARCRARTWPLVLLAFYVLWPATDGVLALAVGVVSGTALVLTLPLSRRVPGALLDLLLGGGALLLYVGTLAPSVQPADAGEFQLVAAVLGIAHPPGYPLYTMLGKLFTLIPLHDEAWRVNLFAAACAGLTLAVVGRTVRRSTGSAAAGLVAALVLGLTPTFWSQATLANVRSLTALLTALALYALLVYGERRAPCDLVAFAILFGLGITHHSSLALLALPFVAYLLAVDPRLAVQPKRWLAPLCGLGGAFLVLVYLPLRSAQRPLFDPAPIRTLGGFLEHVLALGFRGDLAYFLTQQTLGVRFTIVADILRIEWGWVLTAVVLLALVWLARWRWHWLLLCGGVALVNGLAAITYRAPQTVEYLIPAYVALALALGLAGGEVLQRWPQRALPTLAVGLVAWLALSCGMAAYPSFMALHHDPSPRDQAVALLQAAPPGALILANWHRATPLWYLQLVEDLRPDVTVTYVYPEGATPNGEVWARRIREAVAARPVLVTNRFPEYAGLPYRLAPLGETAWTVEVRARAELPAGFSGSPVLLSGKVEFLGAQLAEEEATLGGVVAVQVAWRAPAALDRNYAWFVHLVGPQGIAGQADLTYAPDRVAPGETLVDSYRFPLRPNAAPGAYRLIAGVYVTFPDGRWERLEAAGGQDYITVATLQVRPRATPPATIRPLAVSWRDGSRLVGVDADDSVPGQRRVYLHWYRPAGSADWELSLERGGLPLGRVPLPGGAEAGYRTIACDFEPGPGAVSLEAFAAGRLLAACGPWQIPLWTSVRLPMRGAGARYLDLGGEMILVGARWRPQNPAAGGTVNAELAFLAARPLLADYSVSLSLEGPDARAQHDGTPALGAIPTLKWLAGWYVRDLRLLSLPVRATGQARLGVTVYDAFSLEPLPVGDDRLAQAGQGVQVKLWEGQLR